MRSLNCITQTIHRLQEATTMKRASNALPKSIIALRLVAWENVPNGKAGVQSGDRATEENILDVCEFNTAAEFRSHAKLYADMQASRVSVEIVSSDERMKVKATVEKGIPAGCRTTQPCIRLAQSDTSDSSQPLNDVLLSLDRFWSLLCETAEEMQQPSHFCNDECACNNE